MGLVSKMMDFVFKMMDFEAHGADVWGCAPGGAAA